MNLRWRPIVYGVLFLAALGLVVDGLVEGKSIPVLIGAIYLCWGTYRWVSTKNDSAN